MVIKKKTLLLDKQEKTFPSFTQSVERALLAAHPFNPDPRALYNKLLKTHAWNGKKYIKITFDSQFSCEAAGVSPWLSPTLLFLD